MSNLVTKTRLNYFATKIWNNKIKPIKTDLSNHAGSNIHINSNERNAWNNKSDKGHLHDGGEREKMNIGERVVYRFTPKTKGWYRIAKSQMGVGQSTLEFSIHTGQTGSHTSSKVSIFENFSYNPFILINGSSQTSEYVTSVRIVTPKDKNHNNNESYVELYFSKDVGSSNYAEVLFYITNGWHVNSNLTMNTQVSPNGSVPSTHYEIKSNFTNRTYVSGNSGGLFEDDNSFALKSYNKSLHLSNSINGFSIINNELLPVANRTLSLGSYNLRYSNVFSDTLKVSDISSLDTIISVHASQIHMYSHFIPAGVDNQWKLGQSGNRWKEIWCSTGVISTSDMKYKTNIVPITSKIKRDTNISYYNFLKNMNFCEYDYNMLDKGETFEENPQLHNVGFMAQDIADDEIGKKFVFKANDSYVYNMMSYTGVIGVALQEAIEQIENLKGEIKILKGEI